MATRAETPPFPFTHKIFTTLLPANMVKWVCRSQLAWNQKKGHRRMASTRKAGKRRHEPIYKSFGYAFQGIWECIRDERNIRIHLVMTTLVIIGGIILHISLQEWITVLILFGLVISLELVNTAVESTVDLVTEEKRPLAKKAKDTAAGAVLVSAIAAAIIGLMIFIPRIIDFFR